MRTGAWVAAVASGVAVLATTAGRGWDVPPGLVLYWWAVPLLASAGAVALLACSVVLEKAGDRRLSASLSRAYLVPGPSLGALGTTEALTPWGSPPPWVGSSMLLILLVSAWIFYRSTRGAEEGELPGSGRGVPWEAP